MVGHLAEVGGKGWQNVVKLSIVKLVGGWGQLMEWGRLNG